jgi:type II secretory pathway component GspD/PulD (secretin)
MLLLWAGFSFAAENGRNSQPVQYKIFTLKHISAELGKKYLAEMGIGTVSQLPGTSTILVTAQSSELTKAMAILKLVDAGEEFAIKAICSASENENLPSNEQVAAKVGDISIGTFSSPPEDQAPVKAIIDVHNDFVVAIAPAGLLEKIVSAIGQPMEEDVEKKVEKPRPVGVGRAVPGEPNATAAKKDIRVSGQKTRAAPIETIGVRPYEPEPLPNGDEILNLNLPEKLDLISLITLVGEYLKLDYMYDPAMVKGDVTLKLQGKLRGAMRVKDLYPLLESVMKFKGFVMTRKGNLVTIVPMAQMLENDPTLATEKRRIEFGDVVITRPFQLKHIDTASAMNLLNGMKLGSTVSPIPDTSTLVVTEYAYRMSRIEELLEMIDKPGVPKRFKFRQLKYTMAKTLAPKIKTLAEQLGTVSITIAAAQPTPTPAALGAPPVRVPPGLPVARTTPGAAQAGVYLDSDERTNRILMIGLEEQLTVVDSLIEALDTAQQDLRTMKIYKIEHVGAEEVKKKLQELGIIGGGTETSSRITGTQRAATPEAAGQPPMPGMTAARTTGATGAVTEALVEQPQVIVIEPTNSLLINATAEQHIQIVGIIRYVDSETERTTIPYVIYPLENQKPEDLAEILNKLIQETIKDKEGKIQQVVKKTEEEIIIVPDKNTFSIIVYANKKNQEWIATLIKTLDKRRPQVLIDVTLVEISEVDAFSYDLQLISKFPQMISGGSMQKLGSGSTALLSPFPSDTVREATSILGDTGSGKGFYADRHIQALLQLMSKKGYGRVLSKPKILVNDNEKGHIDTTNTIYVSRSASTVATNVTGGGTPISTSYTFDEFPSGIQLDITPHISEGSLLRLELKMQRSSQVAPQGGIKENEPPPNKTENNVETVVTVPDNSTIILGGILTLDQTKKNWKVPLLGDVPIVGGLFRKIDDSSLQSKLYVFVKANILRPSEEGTGLADITIISEKNKAAFEKLETAIQTYEELPAIKPKPMEPFHVLEVE